MTWRALLACPCAVAAACGLAADTPLVQLVKTEGAGRDAGNEQTLSKRLSGGGGGGGGGGGSGKSGSGGGGGGGGKKKVEPSYPDPALLSDLQCFMVMPQDHINYAVTWITLSVSIVRRCSFTCSVPYSKRLELRACT